MNVRLMMSEAELRADAYDACFDRGRAFYERGEYDQAIVEYSRAIELDPDGDFSVYYNRACAYARNGEPDPAIADYNKAMSIIYNCRSLVYWAKGDHEQAWDDVRRCRELGGTLDDSFLERLRSDAGRKE